MVSEHQEEKKIKIKKTEWKDVSFRGDLKVSRFWSARMWKGKDFPQSGGCTSKGSVHPGLVPEVFVGGQQQLEINVETNETRTGVV